MNPFPLVWIDAHLSPSFGRWLAQQFSLNVVPVRDLGLLTAEDTQIFEAAEQAGAIVITKDIDFVELVMRFGSPPQVVWVRCGNTSNARLQEIFLESFAQALKLLMAGEPLVEVNDKTES
ncbi:MAG: DUF5615 family PIN-like protein [Fimbriimonadia bacterium]|nr:DUF5615 family PIN-like protein [Fimbriimonadia bacterium]